MYLDYSKINSGQAKQPVLRLRTLAGKELGAIPLASNVEFDISYSAISKIEFDVAARSDGVENPIYKKLTGYKVVYTDDFGIYVLSRPTISGDGVSETKHITGYSLEQLFEKKKLFLEEGTYNFWNPATPDDTILGRIIETDKTWSVGYVDPKLIGCYRTFDEYDSDPLSFSYSDAMEKYNCAIVFDVYNKTINAYDASKSRGTLPIYLSYDNLIESVDLEELTDDIVTKLHVYGSDDLRIRDVNPTGTDYLIDLSYFISNGDLDIRIGNSSKTLAEKVLTWNKEIKNNQAYYTGLVAARSSKSAQKLAEEVQLTTLKGELDTLTAQQSVIIQAIAMETTDSGKKAQQKKLDKINEEIEAKNEEIARQNLTIDEIQAAMERYIEDIKKVNQALSFTSYFTEEEQDVLNNYMIEDTVSEETFVATSVDTSASGVSSELLGAVSLTNADISKVVINDKAMCAITGGVIKVPNSDITADIVRGTFELPQNGVFVLSAYLGAITYGEHTFPSGMITLSGTLAEFESDIVPVTEDDVTENKGSWMSFEADDGKLFFTVNVSDYQKYSVAQELYEYGEEVLAEKAWPFYEFSIGSANFLFQKEFEPFKNKLELGKAVHLRMDRESVIKPKIIGIAFSFENPESFTLTFSNQYQTKNGVEYWRNEIESASSSSRSFDASKYLYNRAASKTTQMSQFMEGTLNAAVNTILGAENQSVVINGAGIQIGGDSKYKLRIVDNMLAMTDDGWKTAKLAIGRFSSEETGEQWGVNADLIAGKLIIGNNMILENATDDGVMQFKVDATGAWLNNSTMVLQKDNGGRMILDPKYGLLAGTKMLFDTDGTTVKPSFIDSDGDIVLDDDGMPENTNFFLDISNGDAYFRGDVKATSGYIGGFTIADDFLHAGSGGTYVALNGSGSNENSVYAMWAGSSSPEMAKFWVKKNGDMYAKNGTFQGVVSGAQFKDSRGNSMMNDDYEFTADYLNLNGIDVGDGNFVVDANGNVSMNGSITLGAGSTINWAQVDNKNLSSNPAYTLADDAREVADAAYSLAYDNQLPEYITETSIDNATIVSPTIKANVFEVHPNNSQSRSGGFHIYGNYGSKTYHMLAIEYFAGDSARVNFYSPAEATATWNFDASDFYGSNSFYGDMYLNSMVKLGSNCFGASLPSGEYGRLFFLIE